MKALTSTRRQSPPGTSASRSATLRPIFLRSPSDAPRKSAVRLPVDAIYYISLRKAAIRRKWLVEHLTSLNLTDKYGNAPEWHIASDGSKLDTWVNNSIKNNAKRPKVSQSEIGCIMSHRQLWTICVQNELDYMLILEDDAGFYKDKLYALAEHWDKLPQFDFLHLGWENYKAYVEQVIEEYPIPELPNLWKGNGMWLTHGYIVSQEGARILLERTAPIYNGLDAMTAEIQGEMESYGFKPHICFQRKDKEGLKRTQIIHTG